MPVDFSARARLPDFASRGRSPLYYDTEQGRAVVSGTRNGEPYLEGENFGGAASSFKQLTPVFSEGEPVKSPSPVVATPTRRSLGERFTSTLVDQANRNPFVAGGTALAPKGTYTLPGSDAVFSSAGTQAVQAERERRAAYDAAASADPWFRAKGGLIGKAAAGGATLAGGLAGSMADPVNIATLPLNGGKGLLSQVLTQGGVNAGLDIPTQALDVASGVQDKYNPLQTGGAALFGAAVPVAGRGLHAGGQLLGDLTRRGAEIASQAVKSAADALPQRSAAPKTELKAKADFSQRARAPKGQPAYDPYRLGDQLDAPPSRAQTVTPQTAQSAITSAFPGAKVTSIWRSPEHNRDVGGVPTSLHLRGEAMDFVPPKGVTKEQVREELQRRGLPVTELLDEGDHIHWGWGAKATGSRPTHPTTGEATTPAPERAAPFEVGPRTDNASTVEAVTSRVAPSAPSPKSGASGRYNDLLANIADTTANGQGHADLLPDHDVAAFGAELASHGWRNVGNDTWMGPRGEALFIRSQGESSRPIVQWKPGPTASRPRSPAEDGWLPDTPGRDQPQSSGPDITDRALELLRNGQEARVNRGPSLGEYLASRGGLAPNGDLLAMDLERWHRSRPFQRKLVADSGVDLERAAQMAHEAGYFPEVPPARMDGRDNMHPVTAQMLLDALHQETRGTPRYANEAPADAEDLASHARDLEEMLYELGLDPRSMSNAQIKAELDRHFAAPEPVGAGGPDFSHRAVEAAPAAERGAIAGATEGGFTPSPREATYVDADGYPATTPPASMPGDYVVRAEPDGSHTVINKAAGWSPVRSGLDRATALSEAARLNTGVAERGAERTIKGQRVQFPDAAHAAVYDLGEKIQKGASASKLGAEVDRLRRNIGRYMDWSEDLARHPSLLSKFEGEDHSIPPRSLFVKAAREYAAEIDKDPKTADVSLYDPERTGDLLRDTGQGAKLASRTAEPARPKTDAERYLEEEKMAPGSGPLADRIARGERATYKRHVGPGGAVDHVVQRNLADLLPDGHAGVVYHDTNLSNALSILRRTLEGFRRHDRIYVSPDRDLALGQAGKGVVLEFDATKANGYRPASLQNETLTGAFGKDAELVIDKTVKSAVRAISVKTVAQLEKLRATPWVASRFDVEHPQPHGKGFRVERIVPAATEREATGTKLAMRGAGETPEQRRQRLGDAWRNRRQSASGPDFSHRATEGDKKAAIDLSAYGDAVSSRTKDHSGQPRPGAVPNTGKAGSASYHGKRLAEMADDLARSMEGTPVRQGRLSIRKAAGEFDTGSGVVRTKAAQEIDVRAHELTHALEFTLKPPALLAALKKYAADLKKLAYPGAADAEKRIEGFAEFGRWYITNPDHARKLAPAFYDAFEQALAKDAPAILKKWQAVQSEYRAYLKAPSTGVVAANVIRQPSNKLWGSEKLRRYFDSAKRDGIPSTVQMMADEVWEERVDKFHYLNVALREARNIAQDTLRRAAKPEDKAKAKANLDRLNSLKTTENPYRLGRMVGGAYSSGHMDIRHGVHPYHAIDPEGPSIPQALNAAMGGRWSERTYDDYGAYLISRRMLHEWDRYAKGKLDNPPDMLSRDAHEQAIKDFEFAYPRFKDAAAMAHEYARNLWRKRYEGGLITQETYEAGIKEHADYVPTQRDVTDKARGGKGQVATGAGKFTGGAKRFKGSSRSFIHPIQSLMRESYELNVLLARNDVLKALDDMAQLAGPGGGAIVERIPATQLKGITVDATEAARAAARDAGLSDRDTQTLVQTIEAQLDDNLTGTIFRSQAMHEKGEPIVYVWREGKKIPLRLPDGEFGKRMFDALSGMTPQMQSAVLDAFAMASRIQRSGITTHPAFLFANYLRDQLSAPMLTDVGYKPFLSGARGIGEEIAGTKTARRYNALGGIMGGLETSSLGEVRPELNARRIARGPRHPTHLLSLQQLVRATELSETGTRLGVFRNAFQKAKRSGLSDYEAGKEAIFTARDYFDTDLHGSRMLVMRRIVPFLNAGIQGLSKAARNATAEGNLQKVLAPIGKNAPRNAAERQALYRAYKLVGLMSALGVWGLAQSHLYADDPEYQAFDVQERATNWFFKRGDTWYRYPKPFELASGSNVAEGLYEALKQHDPKALDRMFRGLYDVIVPPTSIPWITGAWEAATNKDYGGRPIVPEHLRGQVDPELQYNSYTSELGKKIGATLHVSPALVDHWINTVFGSWGQEVTGATRKHNGAALAPEDTPVLRRFTSAPERGSLDATEFYGEMARDGGKLSQALGTFRLLTKDPAQDAKAIDYLNGLDSRTRAYVVSQAFSSKGSGDLHPLTRAQNAVGVISDVRTDIREGRITDVYGRPIALTPPQLQQADKALARISWEEMRNALVTTGAPGWAQKKPVPVAPEMAKLSAINPALAQAVQVRMLEQKVLPEGLNQMVWNKVQPAWQAPIPDQQLSRLLTAKRLMSSDPTSKRQEAMRLANGGGLLTPPSAAPPTGLLASHAAGLPLFAGGRR